jgi:hypothetical protein
MRDEAREVCALVVALDADAAGPQQWRQLVRQAALRACLKSLRRLV